MKKKISFLLFWCISLITLGQNERERQTIIQNSNVETLKKLSEGYRKQSIADYKYAIEFAKKRGLPILQKLSDGRVAELQRINPDGTPIYYISHSNVNSAKLTGTNKLWTGGSMGLNLNGQGMTIGLWELGKVRLTHQEFGGRAIQKDGEVFTNYDLNNDHATHVGGTLIASGVVQKVKGMAHQATLWANTSFQDTAEMAAQAAEGLLFSNHSYGYQASALPASYFGFYDQRAADWDRIAWNAPYYTIVKSAGNDRDDGFNSGGIFGTTGYNLLMGSSTSKNVLVVGATFGTGSFLYTGPTSVNMTDFSSWGPTDDGRIKPDVVGNGSCESSSSLSDTSITAKYGTSMAAPNITGTLALIQQHYKNKSRSYSPTFMRAATLRGLIIHTANELGANPGPDYAYGWGLIDAEKAVRVINNRGDSSIIEERILKNGTSYSFNVKAMSNNVPIEVTIAWNDPTRKPLPSGTTNSTERMLVNDLDLRLKNGTDIYYPWTLDPSNPVAAAKKADNSRDNVEKVVISNPIAGTTYTVIISHKATLSRKASQPYSIIATGINKNP